MKPTITEWVAKAEGDFLTAGRELRARKSPNYDAVCFHTQQCAEKYLKAVLQENDKRIPKIHFLLELLAMILKFDGSYELLRPTWKYSKITLCDFDTLVILRKKTKLGLHTPRRGRYENLSGRDWN